MDCPNCGAQLPDEASFCWKCGRPMKMDFKPVTPLAPSKDDEICKLQYRNNLYTGIAYWRATVKDHMIAQSQIQNPTSRSDDPSIKRDANIEVVAKLQADGWEVQTIDKDGCVTLMKRKKKV